MYNNYYFSTATMVARKRLNVTLYVHCQSRHSCGDIANLLIREVRTHGKSGMSVPRVTIRHQDTHTHQFSSHVMNLLHYVTHQQMHTYNL